MLKPIVIFAVILLVLGAMFAWWISLGPSSAVGAGPMVRAEQQRQVDEIIREIDN
ncbi:MAG: hypothetical protein ACYS5V_10940 [Planctomycetota bacterium]